MTVDEESTTDTSRGRPIFITGCQRSGTTLLGLMLQAHPRISIPPENRFLLPVYFDREQFGDLSQPANRRQLAETIVSTRRDMRNFGLDRDEMVERIVAEGSTIGSAIGTVLRAYADQFGKVRWGDKRPEYRSHVWALRRLFPDAQFVHLVRDGRDCVASLKRMPWWNKKGKTSYQAIQTWVEAIDSAQQARRQLPSGAFYELQYEPLVSEPQKQLVGLCEFLGEPFDEAMLSPRSVADQVVPEYKTHHAKTRQEVSPNFIGNWHDGLEPWELELCEAVMSDKLQHYGYELSGAAPPAAEHLEEYHHVDAEQRRKLRRKRKRDEAKTDTQPVADMAATEAAKQRRITVLENRVASLTAERDELRSRLDRTLRSRSWRWTQPLRTIDRTIGRRS